MADSVVETKETTPVVEKEAVSSSVKESPVKESNGSAEKKVEHKNGSGDAPPQEEEEAPKENGDEPSSQEAKENGDATDACAIKRKSCSGEVDAPEAGTPEKKAKLAEEEDSPVAEEAPDAEAIEA